MHTAELKVCGSSWCAERKRYVRSPCCTRSSITCAADGRSPNAEPRKAAATDFDERSRSPSKAIFCLGPRHSLEIFAAPRLAHPVRSAPSGADLESFTDSQDDGDRVAP